jgi:hypothetical protein
MEKLSKMMMLFAGAPPLCASELAAGTNTMPTPKSIVNMEPYSGLTRSCTRPKFFRMSSCRICSVAPQSGCRRRLGRVDVGVQMRRVLRSHACCPRHNEPFCVLLASQCTLWQVLGSPRRCSLLRPFCCSGQRSRYGEAMRERDGRI